jgi:integrase
VSYGFEDPSVPSLAEIIERVRTDAGLPPAKRRVIASRLRQLPNWEGALRTSVCPRSASDFPFTESHFESLMKRLSPAVLGIAPKTLANVLSDGRFILDRYGLRSRGWAPLTPAWAALEGLIEKPFERMQIKRLLCFLSARGVAPGDVSPDHVAPFIQAVAADIRVGDAALAARRALRVWRKLMARHPVEWPQVRLEMPRRQSTWGRRWAEMPALEAAVDGFLAPPPPGQLFKGRRKKKLKPTTVRTQKEAIRCYASALANDGVPIESLTGLRAICTPEAFKRGVGALALRAGAVNHWVEKAARVILKIAKYADVLDAQEIEKVKTLYEEVSQAYHEWSKSHPDRDQRFLDRLDDPRLMNALLALPTRTVRRVVASGRLTTRAAYAVQRALLLELGLCSALRNVNLLGLRIDHIERVEIAGVERTVVRVAASETKNGEATEHFLLSDVADLLTLYLEIYLPIIAGGPTPWLFPGTKGGPKDQQTFRIQMRNFITRHLKLEGFHPHLIRKIVPKIALDEDPNAIEVVRRVGGWKSEVTLRRSYLQKRNRAAQARYVALLEGRRLKAFKPLRKDRGKPNAS